MEKVTDKQCPLCNSPLIETRKPDWDKTLRMYTNFFYRCDKCCTDITIDHGVVTMIDKNGAVILSGK